MYYFSTISHRIRPQIAAHFSTVSRDTTTHARYTSPCIVMWWRKTWERIPQFFSQPFSVL